jgi:hypothetical protein
MFTQEFRARMPQERQSLYRSTYRIPVFSDLLAWPGAQPRVARRAKRLGRSAGPGQRRARRFGGQLGGPLLHLRAGHFMPRMVCRRLPLPFLDRNRHTWARLAGRCIESLRWRWRGVFPPAQRLPAVLDAYTAVPSLACPHFAPRGRIVLCGSSWKKRLSYRTTQSSPTVRSLSSRNIRSSSAARGARR